MNLDIALILTQDGITSAAIYAMLALALILIFTVTRVIYVPQGEFISFGALTLAAVQQGLFPKSIYVLAALGVLGAIYEVVSALRERVRPNFAMTACYLLYPLLLGMIVRMLTLSELNVYAQLGITALIVIPMGSMIYRIVFQPIAGSRVLVLLISAVATQLVLVGLGLLTFGPEGSRTTPLGEGAVQIGGHSVTVQSLISIGVCTSLIVAFAWALKATIYGKALRATAVNRTGARIVGISPSMAGHLCFLVAATVGVIAGALIAPVSTMYYDSGFLIGLKGFVAAIFGGLVNYPIAALGAIALGLTESFVSFWTSAFKEVVIFGLLIPVLLVRSLMRGNTVEDHE